MDRLRKATAGMMIVTLLLQGCSAASLVSVSPREQGPDRLAENQGECERSARLQSGYSLGRESGTWLLTLFGVALIGAATYLSTAPLSWTSDDVPRGLEFRHKVYVQVYQDCMEGRGYRVQEVSGTEASR